MKETSTGNVTETRRRLAAIMFTDMVGYSARAQADEAHALAVLERHNQLLRPIFPRFHGREVKTVGDAFLVEFDSALEAARCALEVQRTLHDHNRASSEEEGIQVRIGIHVGDVVPTDGDLLGDAVNIAARIEPLAEPGGICLTQQVYDQIQNKISVPMTRLPPVALKNIPLSIAVYRFVLSREHLSRETGTPAGTRGRSLAVLPLANISPDPKDEYFADGLTEELISVLSQVRDLSVIARTSVAAYKSAPKSIAQIGAELGVDTVLEGSVRKSGNRIRISLQLVDAATQRHVWASSYNRELDDVFAVQSEIADQAADALKLEFARSTGPGAERRPAPLPEAYDLYLRGLVAASDLDAGGLEEAARCFEQATQRDPNFAEAFASWANLYVMAAGDRVPVRGVMARTRELVGRALELDPDSSDAHSALGNIAFQFDHDWKRAEAEFRKAITLNPSNVTAHRFLGLLLMALCRFEEAKEVFRRAIHLDPGGHNQRSLAWAELETGRVENAIAYGKEDVARDPSKAPPHVYLGFTYLAAGRKEEAAQEAAAPLSSSDEVDRFDHALLNALVGRPEAARTVAAEIETGTAKAYFSAADLAMMYAALGDRERALDFLEKDAREGDGILWLFHRSVIFDSIREDPRFVALLRQYQLPILPLLRPSSSGN